MNWKRCIIRRERSKKIIKMLIFITIIIIPFLSVTGLLGIETFLDSFENSDSYLYLKNSFGLTNSNIKDSTFIIIQESDHPDFDVKQSDIVLYSSVTGNLSCQKVEYIYSMGTLKRYEIKGNDIKDFPETIYQEQIIGKVVKIVDKNIWNSLTLELWVITIDNLNVNNFI